MTRADILAAAGGIRRSTVEQDGRYVTVTTGLDSIDPAGAIPEPGAVYSARWIAALSTCLDAYHAWDCAAVAGTVGEADASEVCWLDRDLGATSLLVSAESVREELAAVRR